MNNRWHNAILNNSKQLTQWWDQRSQGLQFPIYSSFDLRDAGFKSAVVDGNLFPAGFHNICQIDQEASVEILDRALGQRFGPLRLKVVLATEEHTNNRFYWDSVGTLEKLLKEAGHQVLLAFPNYRGETVLVESASGKEFEVFGVSENCPEFMAFSGDLILLNNDFSTPPEAWNPTGLPVVPPPKMGWHQRKKIDFFTWYNQAAREFSQVIGIDEFDFSVQTELFQDFDVKDTERKQDLAHKVDEVLSKIQKDYQTRGIDEVPHVFVKNNSGTYGMGVINVTSGEDVLRWNWSARKKMNSAKGGRDVSEVIIQEGVLSQWSDHRGSQEPVLYLIESELAGGFMRAHPEKGPMESLNSPGAVYQKLCVQDLGIKRDESPLENVYGWIARLGALAIAQESRESARGGSNGR